MSQGAIRPETPRDREERRILEEELATSPVKGAPLRQRLRNFRPDGDSAIRALGGPTLWMRRLRAIEEEVELHEQQLGEAWRELAKETPAADQFARRWRETVRRWSFAQVNELIERHNATSRPRRAADGSADARLREDQRPSVPARIPRRGVGARVFPARPSRSTPRRVIRLLGADDAEELRGVVSRQPRVPAPVRARPRRSVLHGGAAARADRAERGGRPVDVGDRHEGAIAGLIALNDVLRGALQLANVGYWGRPPAQRPRPRVCRPRGRRRLCVRRGAAAPARSGHAARTNVASQRVLERNGFEKFGYARRLLLVEGDWRDHVLFERIAD